jgi:hypothetical protein
MVLEMFILDPQPRRQVGALVHFVLLEDLALEEIFTLKIPYITDPQRWQHLIVV